MVMTRRTRSSTAAPKNAIATGTRWSATSAIAPASTAIGM